MIKRKNKTNWGQVMFKKILKNIEQSIELLFAQKENQYANLCEKIKEAQSTQIERTKEINKLQKVISSQQETIRALSNALCDKYKHGLFVYSENFDIFTIIRNGVELVKRDDMISEVTLRWRQGEAPYIDIEQCVATYAGDELEVYKNVSTKN